MKTLSSFVLLTFKCPLHPEKEAASGEEDSLPAVAVTQSQHLSGPSKDARRSSQSCAAGVAAVTALC